MPSPKALADYTAIVDRVVLEPRRKRSSTTTLMRAALSLRRPTVATVNGCSPAFAAKFDALLQEDFDVVQVEHSYTFDSLSGPLARHKKTFFLSEHNIESDVVELQYQRLPKPLRMLGGVDAVRARIWEQAVFRRATCVIAVSPSDEIYFRQNGARETALVPNCIDTSFHTHVMPSMCADKLLFLGNFEYSPNVAAVERLCDTILPLVWAHRPSVKLQICGYAMPTTWRHIWPDARIEFVGYVSSVAEAHAGSSIFVAPIDAGGGSKLKVIEAMASGLPVVATAQAMSGMTVQDHVHFRAAESSQEIADAVVELLLSPNRAVELGAAGRRHAVANHDWSVAADVLERVYARHQ